MTSKNIVITAPNGLHARPVGELVKLVKSFADSAVTLSTPVKTVKASSMLSILSLGLKQGSEVEVKVEGGDEAQVLEAVSSFISSITE
ncbi:MAG: HPr family phosphocarrier protein [Bacteroidales bacterium]|nr:HPr family phosphocarrier protein [Bacteroidales bacterium]